MIFKKEEIENMFTYHPPKKDQTERYELLRKKAKALATAINRNCPDSIEAHAAIEKLREVIMFANASIACNE